MAKLNMDTSEVTKQLVVSEPNWVSDADLEAQCAAQKVCAHPMASCGQPEALHSVHATDCQAFSSHQDLRKKGR